jgi:IS1 family transposase
MNVLPHEKKIAAIAALTEGCSIRATERLTDIHRDTIMRLGVRVGEGCADLHDRMMRGLHVPILEFDEIWAYVGKKQRKALGQSEAGDQYTYVALDATNKAIVSYMVGKRNAATTQDFVDDVWRRIANRPQITTDGYEPYIDAIQAAFGYWVDYAQLVKQYKGEPSKDAARRYSPGWIIGVNRKVVSGRPRYVSTSYVERSNLTMRMQSRRFTRLTNGFSKKLRNHKAAVALYVAHYNLCRVHETLQITPAMALGVTGHIWDIGELIEAALSPQAPEPVGRRVGRFTVIDGGAK